jgi:glycosyltransferase involved in cell wall biosynthesis
MRILLAYHQQMVSFETYLWAFAPALAARGHDVHVLSCGHRKQSDEYRDGVWVHRRRDLGHRTIRMLSRSSLRRLSRFRAPAFPPWQSPVTRVRIAVSNYVEFKRLADDFDVIEVPEHLGEGLAFTLLDVKPVVVELHGPVSIAYPIWGYAISRRLRLADGLEQLAARRATVAISPSTTLVDELKARGWANGIAPRVIPHAIDLASWSGVGHGGATDPVILQVGTIGLRKGTDLLIRAAARLAPEVKGLRVVLVGNSDRSPDGRPMELIMAQLAERLGVPCTVVGWQPRTELRRWYEIARLVAVPSRYESFSLAAIEALAAGRPVVCSSVTGLSDLVRETDGALTVVPVEDVDALAEAMRPYLVDAEAADAAGRRGRAFVERRLSPERIAAEREEVYEDAVRIWRAKRTHTTRDQRRAAQEVSRT